MIFRSVYEPTEGEIVFHGKTIHGLRPYQITGHGVARTFQNIRLFPSLSVFDNVRVAFHLHVVSGVAHSLTRGPIFRNEEASIATQVMDLLEIFKLGRFRDQPARSLPYGDQRRLEIARALATDPRILMLDEPNAGMNPTETDALLDLIRRIRDELGVTVILIAHDIPLVMTLADRISVLNFGSLIAEGEPAAVRADPEVIAAYLGTARHG